MPLRPPGLGGIVVPIGAVGLIVRRPGIVVMHGPLPLRRPELTMATVFLGPAMRDLVGGAASLEAHGSSVRELVADLGRRHPELLAHICDGDQFRPGLTVAVDNVIFSTRVAMYQDVRPDSEVHFVAAIPGG